ncbi:MAG: ArnT family glycosyltransferase [Blastocatellia bacterium]
MPTLPERARDWFAAELLPPAATTHKRLLIACAIIFVTATGVRLLYWQDRQLELSEHDTLRQNMARQYRREALRMLAGGGILFPNEAVDPDDAMLLVHPPGYALLMAVSFKAFGERDAPLRWLQIISDALGCVLILLIAAEFLPFAVAATAGSIAALSPQFGYYALQLSPDSLAALPILIAVYLLARVRRRPHLLMFIAAGVMLGLSCWLRANALLLAPFLALATFTLKRDRRWRDAAVFIAAVVVTMSPLIIRNRVLFHQAGLLPVPGGLNLVQGIAEMDREGRFGMPRTDVDALQKDIEWHNRPDYAKNLWSPDGIERDRYRAERGLAIIRENPGWFAGAMLRRAAFMLHYNDTTVRDWPFSTATVPPVAARAAFSHSLMTSADAAPVWTLTAKDWMMQASHIAPQATTELAADGATFKLTGDDSSFGDQLAATGINVARNTDYVVALSVRVEAGKLAAKVTDAAGQAVLAGAGLSDAPLPGRGRDADADDDAANQAGLRVTQIAFASGSHEQVRVVLSNNGGQAIAEVGAVELYEQGRTAQAWTRWLRPLVRGVQKNVYTTARMLVLIGCGLVLLVFARRWQVLVMLLTVPVYYLLTHPAFSTEYRYILAMHFFLFVLAAVALFVMTRGIIEGARRLKPFITGRRTTSRPSSATQRSAQG